MSKSADARRRWFGAFFLILAAGQTTWGLTVLQTSLRGKWFVFYWLSCFGFIALALLTALLDLRAVRKRAREQERELFNRTMRGLPSEDEEP